MSEKWRKTQGSDNPILNAIGNLCGRISHMFLKPHMRWGTMYEWDMDEEIDREDW